MSTLKRGGLCPQCEKGELSVIIKNLTFAYKGGSKEFPNEMVFKCDVCDYEGLTHDDNERIDKVLADFRRSIDGLLSCNNLKSIRTELGLNKKKMATLLSVNEKTIGRYENGKVTQSEHMDKLYRVLQAFPMAAKIIESSIETETANFRFSYDPEPASNYNIVTNDYFIFKEAANAA